MSKKIGKTILRYLLVVVVTVLTLAIYGLVINLAGRTLCAWWPVALTAVAAGAAMSGLTSRFWMWLFDLWYKWVGIVCGIIFVTGAAMLSFYGVNAWVGDDIAVVDTRVERKYYQTRYHSRRVGRRTYARGTPYKVYMVDVSLPDGRQVTMTVGLERYNRLRKGAQMPVEVTHGFFGADVVDLMRTD